MRRAEDQRDEQQKSDRHDEPERQQASTKERPEAAALLLRRRAPDPIERALQLSEHRSGADDQRDEPDDRRGPRRLGFRGVRDDVLDRFGAVWSDQSLELGEHLAFCRLDAEHGARNANDDQEQRRHGEERVVGQGRAHAGRVVLLPRPDGLREHVSDGAPARSTAAGVTTSGEISTATV